MELTENATFDVEVCDCIPFSKKLVVQGLFPTTAYDVAIDCNVFELYRKLNVRSALPINAITDVMEGNKNCSVVTFNSNICIEYEPRMNGFYDMFCDSFYSYRSVMLRLEHRDIEFFCPACPKVC